MDNKAIIIELLNEIYGHRNIEFTDVGQWSAKRIKVTKFYENHYYWLALIVDLPNIKYEYFSPDDEWQYLEYNVADPRFSEVFGEFVDEFVKMADLDIDRPTDLRPHLLNFTVQPRREPRQGPA